MPTIKNISPIGDLDVPLLRRIVLRDEVVEVTEAQALRMLPQSIWEAVDEEAAALQADIDDLAAADAALAEEGVNE